jgi:hypothetical protein
VRWRGHASLPKRQLDKICRRKIFRSSLVRKKTFSILWGGSGLPPAPEKSHADPEKMTTDI